MGVAGFVPGITTDYDRMTFANHHSGAMLLGVFVVSVLHNLVHLASDASTPRHEHADAHAPS